MKQFVIDIISRFKIDDAETRVGVVSFSTTAVINFHLQQYDDVDEIAQKIWDLTYMGGISNAGAGISVIGYVLPLRQFNFNK